MSSPTSAPLWIRYHRDFDGMVSGALLKHILRTARGHRDLRLLSVNHDQRRDWANFAQGLDFAIVDFHFHPRATYWFDHHPTTFLSPEDRAHYEPSEYWFWDERSPSCPPLILAHAARHYGYEGSERFLEAARWSDRIDTATFESVDQALFAEDPAMRIMRALAAAPSPTWTDELAEALVELDLTSLCRRPDVERAYAIAVRNRDQALRQFPSTVLSMFGHVCHYDATSDRVRRERFAAFYHHPKALYSVGVIPTRAGFHVTAGENPWNKPKPGMNIGELMTRYGGGGHHGVGGVNPASLETAREIAREVAEHLRRGLGAIQ
jgi:hypothetical protein